MENIFEQMRKYKGKKIRTKKFQWCYYLEEADQLTGDERKQFAEKVWRWDILKVSIRMFFV
jgi:hypothetical protein